MDQSELSINGRNSGKIVKRRSQGVANLQWTNSFFGLQLVMRNGLET